MTYKDADITYGSITTPSGIEIPGWVITRGGRRTIASSRELAQTFVEAQIAKDKIIQAFCPERKPRGIPS